MKLILKEKKKSLQEADQPQKANRFRVRVDPQVILDLTPPEKSIAVRAQGLGKFSQIQADVGGGIYVAVDPSTGEVIEHGGRARSQAAINSGLKSILASVAIPHEAKPMTWEELPNTFYQQEGGSKAVPKTAFEYIPEKDDVKDILGLGDDVATFETVIIPKGHRFPNGNVLDADYIQKDGVKDAIFFINQIYHKLYRHLRKVRKWGEYGFHHDEVADVADENVKNNYIVTDSEGELRPHMGRGGLYRMQFDREPVPPIEVKTRK